MSDVRHYQRVAVALSETRCPMREIDEKIPGWPMSQPAARGLAIITIAKSGGIVTDVLIRGVPEEVVEALKRRARAHNRSLQGELRELLIESSGEGAAGLDGAALARRVRERIEAERGATLEDDSADIVRADREAR